MRALGAGLGAALLLVGCGDPAVDGAYEGQARFELGGLVCAIGNMDSPSTAMGIVWTTLAADATPLARIAGEAQGIDASVLPADFQLSLFDLPPGAATTRLRTDAGVVDLAIGIPVLFDDLDADGTFALSREPVLGVSRGQVILHRGSPAAIDATEVTLALDSLRSEWAIGKAVCDDVVGLTGFDLQPVNTGFDVWLFQGVIVNPLETLAPKTCLMPF